MVQQSVYLHYLSALLDGDRRTCLRIVDGLLDKKDIDIKSIYINLIQRSMYRIGHLWETERVSVADEHIATKITDSVLNLIQSRIEPKENNGKRIVMTCVDKEFHELGARIVADYMEYKGWNVSFLGANTPKFDLLKIIEHKKPDLVGISNNLYLNFIRVFKMIDEIKKTFPEQNIILGGQSFNEENLSSLEKYENVFHITDLKKLDKFLEEFSYTTS